MSIVTANVSANASTSGAAAVELDFDMGSKKQYQITARGADMWISVVLPGGTPAAIGGEFCHFVPQNSSMLVAAIPAGVNSGGVNQLRTRISFIRDASVDVMAVLSELANPVYVNTSTTTP